MKDEVDIWIAPGRVIEMNSTEATIVDNDSGYTSAVTCNITGYGIIKNSTNSDSCIRIINGASNVSVQCDTLEAIGAVNDPYKGSSVLITNITDAQKFSLRCNKIVSQYGAAIAFDTVSSGTNKNSINIAVGRIDTGIVDDDSTTPAVILKGTGFVEIDEINCLNSCSCR